MNRPRLMLSISAAMRAISAGCRYGTQLTTEPSRTRSVTPASAARQTQGSACIGRMVEDEAAVESERLDLAAGIEQSPQPRIAEDELNSPANAVVSLGDPWMTRHASPRSSAFRRSRAPVSATDCVLGSPVAQALDGLGDARAHSLRADDPQGLEQPRRLGAPGDRDADRHEEAAGLQPQLVGQGPEARLARLLIVEIDLGQECGDRLERSQRFLPRHLLRDQEGRIVRLQLGLKEIRHQLRRFRQRLETVLEQRHDRLHPREIGMLRGEGPGPISPASARNGMTRRVRSSSVRMWLM